MEEQEQTSDVTVPEPSTSLSSTHYPEKVAYQISRDAIDLAYCSTEISSYQSTMERLTFNEIGRIISHMKRVVMHTFLALINQDDLDYSIIHDVITQLDIFVSSISSSANFTTDLATASKRLHEFHESSSTVPADITVEVINSIFCVAPVNLDMIHNILIHKHQPNDFLNLFANTTYQTLVHFVARNNICLGILLIAFFNAISTLISRLTPVLLAISRLNPHPYFNQAVAGIIGEQTIFVFNLLLEHRFITEAHVTGDLIRMIAVFKTKPRFEIAAPSDVPKKIGDVVIRPPEIPPPIDPVLSPSSKSSGGFFGWFGN